MTDRRFLLVPAALVALAFSATPVAAWRAGLALTSATADLGGSLFDPTQRDLRPYDVPETGVRLSVQSALGDRWAVEAGAGWSAYSLRIEKPAGDCVDPLRCDRLEVEHAQTSAWSGRVSLLRMTAPDARLSLFAGPGVEWWSGHATHRLDDGSSTDGPSTTRLSALLRFGAELPVHRGLRLRCAVGERWGRAHTVYGLNSSTWWPGNFEAELGLMTGGAR